MILIFAILLSNGLGRDVRVLPECHCNAVNAPGTICRVGSRGMHVQLFEPNGELVRGFQRVKVVCQK